jgi:flagellar hook protein FlgE
MSDISAVALSGVRASERKLAVAADNIANQGNPDFKPKEVKQSAAPEGGVESRVVEREGGEDLSRDVVDAQVAQYTAEANLKVLKTNDDLLKQIVDLQA